ncbi:MAG: methyltransferase [Rhizobiales bacterium 65-9]|nr:MAG: methyltransferase [Rhizobiales bacterium 65-9]
MRRDARPDPAAFIRANLRVASPRALPEIRLYLAHSGSRLSRLAGADPDEPPYWAYCWAGGAVLARHLLDHPETVARQRILDLGAGCGVVAIATAKAGASEVVAMDIDPNAVAAVALNAALNDVAVAAHACDPLDGPPPDADMILVGDLFYEPALAARATAFLGRCVEAGKTALIGDPGRAHLPRARLVPLSRYPAPDVGDAPGEAKAGAVYRFR